MQNKITKFLKYGTLLSTYGLLGSVLLQIFARFFLTSAPSWTEEASRLFFIYATAFAGGLAVKSNEYVYLDIIYEKLSSVWKKILSILVQLLTFLLFGLMAFYSLKFVQLGWTEKAPAMRVSMSIAFFSMFILSISICYFTWRDFSKKQKI